jgi:hypothetical protein
MRAVAALLYGRKNSLCYEHSLPILKAVNFKATRFAVANIERKIIYEGNTNISALLSSWIISLFSQRGSGCRGGGA